MVILFNEFNYSYICGPSQTQNKTPHIFYKAVSRVKEMTIDFATDNGPFTILHENTHKCLQIKNGWVVSVECTKAKDLLWKWVSHYRLFHLESQKCLGLENTKGKDSVKMFTCDSSVMLWWKCDLGFVHGANHLGLILKNGILTTSANSSDSWKKGDSDENLCDRPYLEIYTQNGNSYGKPCEFPFLHNGIWHHDCISGGDQEGLWCSTSINYDDEGEWGICLKPENGCEVNWEKNPQLGNCYQVNTQTALSWKNAYLSCQSQGADLLSIGSVAELNYLVEKDSIPRTFWLGLNQLDSSGGWEWSDHTPLNFLNWSPEMPGPPNIGSSSCTKMSAKSREWQSFPCDAVLPYICKKQLNNTVELPDVWTYVETRCDLDWLPSNGYCYLMVNETDSWDNANVGCQEKGSNLISIHSLADVEVIIQKLHKDTREEIWTGFKSKTIPTEFQWSDDSKVTFTYWDHNEPNIAYSSTPNCVSYSGKLGRWRVRPCGEKLKYGCKKRGENVSETPYDKECPQEKGWKRHGEACYKIYENKVPFGTICNLTITSRFEQEYLNSIIKKYSKTEGNYFWTGLRDADSQGEYNWASVGRSPSVTYVNWNTLQPASPGGCVAMSSGMSLGRWEVKNCKSFRALSICKKRIGPPEKETPINVDAPCPDGWKGFPSSHSCYRFFHKNRILKKRTWEEAEQFCQALGAHLPSFTHNEEIKAFHKLLKTQLSDSRWIWIGLNQRSPDYQGSWQWSDNSPMSSFVIPPEFQENYDVRDCAAFRVGYHEVRHSFFLWNHFAEELDILLKPFACDVKLEWACQIPKGQIPEAPVWFVPGSGRINGLPVLTFEETEYWFVVEPRLSFEEAFIYCTRNESSLASFNSFAEFQTIRSEIQNISGDEQKWWAQPLFKAPYSYFHSRYNYLDGYEDGCWFISSKLYRGFHRKINCDTQLPFICGKKNASLFEKYIPGPEAKKPCPAKWSPFKNKCFLKVKNQNLTFAEANHICTTYGGTLPSVLSQSEQDFITMLLPDLEQKFWIGLKEYSPRMRQKWIDGQELNYKNFHPLLKGREDNIPFFIDLCTVMLNLGDSPFTGTWNFTECSTVHSLSLCQRYSEVQENQTQKNVSETMKFQDHLYKIIMKNLSWYDAQEECLSDNMQLVSITDPYQQAFLSVQAALLSSPLWVGLYSISSNLDFRWSDGKQVNFSRWFEDSDQLLDDCAILDPGGFWKTSDCESGQPGAICYFPGKNEEKVKQVETVKCPHAVLNTPWIPFRNSCYSFMIAPNRYIEQTTAEMNIKCQKMNPGARVLSIRDEHENTFVQKQLQTFHSLALWVVLGVTYYNNSLIWSDMTRMTYTNWQAGRPTVKNDRFYAGLNLDGLWDIFPYGRDILYFHQHNIQACKIEMGDATEEFNYTLPQLIPYGDSVYSVVAKRLSWYKALQICQQNGGDLASVHDKNGSLFLEDIVRRDGFPLWVGLSSHDGTGSNFEWSDGSAFDYIPWKDKLHPGNCISLNPKGIWKHENCDSIKDGAICYRQSPKTKQAQVLTPDSGCSKTKESQWFRYKDYCYTFGKALYGFSEAKMFCQNIDPQAIIVSIKDEDENKFVSKLIRENKNITMRVWLGLSQHSSDRSWHWLDGSVAQYVKWKKKTNAGGNCSILLATSEAWNKVKCDQGYGRVVCKKSVGTTFTGVALAFVVITLLALFGGLIWYLYKKNHLHWTGFTSVRYEPGVNEDDAEVFTSFND
ncbi:lymphocyte antigen 75 [Ornithorhynchus anatinus]|uniref:lymphocyte antigen 75 n=1 Tax=Ornithorhynchus anatinus TaxID=9258 RepID=UPI0019D48526|nr:lymphocyte antigen 75 [Ornithorhynchus anatinus]